MGFVEAAMQRASAMTAGAKGDALGGIVDIGQAVISSEQGRDIGKACWRGQLAGEEVGHG